jgi:polyhydroxybutyrate depolymerase
LRRLPGLVFLSTTVVLATGSTIHRGAPGAATCAGKPGSSPLAVASGGRMRSAVVHLPPAVRRGRPVPLVLALHGAGGNGPWMEYSTGLSGLADREGFAVAYPTATGTPPRWNVAGPPGKDPDDVGFVRDLLAALQGHACVDSARVFATGVSNGGGMAARLGCELSDRLRAIAPVAGGYSALPPCVPVRPVSVLEIHGTGDHVVPYWGRGPARQGDVLRFVRGWAQRDRCPPHPARTMAAPGIGRLAWAPCYAGSVVEHLRVMGGRHVWPVAARGHGRRLGLSASLAVLRFFAALRG